MLERWPLLRLMRLHQWLKSSFVFAGLFFSHAWHNFSLIQHVTLVAIVFAGLSSGMYIINDLVDKESDQAHPSKKQRPIANGEVTVPTALGLAGALVIVNLGIGFWLSIKVGVILSAYVMVGLLYSFYVKQIVLLDVGFIAIGFMLRILAGTYGVNIVPSPWLLLCGSMLTLFLGFAKRCAELRQLGSAQVKHRRVLCQYNQTLLNNMIWLTASGIVLSYSLYTISPATIQMHHTTYLTYTIPLVMYGLLRYLYLLYNGKQGSGIDTARDIMYDLHLRLALSSWLFLTFALLIKAN